MAATAAQVVAALEEEGRAGTELGAAVAAARDRVTRARVQLALEATMAVRLGPRILEIPEKRLILAIRVDIRPRLPLPVTISPTNSPRYSNVPFVLNLSFRPSCNARWAI